MSPFQTGAPPLPPSVTQQQAPVMDPAAVFASSQFGAAAPQAGQGNSFGFAATLLKQVEDNLTKAAQVIQVVSPELMPYIQIMAQAGSQLTNLVMEKAQGNSIQQGPSGNDGSPMPDDSLPAMTMQGGAQL